MSNHKSCSLKTCYKCQRLRILTLSVNKQLFPKVKQQPRDCLCVFKVLWEPAQGSTGPRARGLREGELGVPGSIVIGVTSTWHFQHRHDVSPHPDGGHWHCLSPLSYLYTIVLLLDEYKKHLIFFLNKNLNKWLS